MLHHWKTQHLTQRRMDGCSKISLYIMETSIKLYTKLLMIIFTTNPHSWIIYGVFCLTTFLEKASYEHCMKWHNHGQSQSEQPSVCHERTHRHFMVDHWKQTGLREYASSISLKLVSDRNATTDWTSLVDLCFHLVCPRYMAIVSNPVSWVFVHCRTLYSKGKGTRKWKARKKSHTKQKHFHLHLSWFTKQQESEKVSHRKNVRSTKQTVTPCPV